MRLTSLLTGLLMAATTLAVIPSSAYADTGGGTLFFSNGKRLIRAPAADLSRRTMLVPPTARFGRGYPVDVLPSPNGRLVAQVWKRVEVRRGVYVTRVVVSDRNGRHSRVVWARPSTVVRGVATDWDVDGMSWGRRVRGGVPLYFAAVRTRSDVAHNEPGTTTKQLVSTVVPPKKRPRPVASVKGGRGLVSPTVDPTTGRLAAVRLHKTTCDDSKCVARSTIEILNPRNGARRDLFTATMVVGTDESAGPIAQLAWSPDGAQIAFQQSTCCPRPEGSIGEFFLGEIGVVAADGSDGDSYRVAVPYDERHLVAAPTWRNARSLWFERSVFDNRIDDGAEHEPGDLYSVSVQPGEFGPLVQRTRTASGEYAPSFG